LTSAGHPARAIEPALRWAGSAAFALSALALAYMLAGALINGPQARAAAERDRAIAIEQEDQTFCSSLNISPTNEMYARCRSGLADIRRRHEERLSADIGIL
jgi:hypothetical protein